jgi:hypothetical protein
MAVARSRPIPELTTVTLTHPFECRGGLLPEGTRGAVVHAYEDGAAYEVEFDVPFHCVVTLQPKDIRPV